MTYGNTGSCIALDRRFTQFLITELFNWVFPSIFSQFLFIGAGKRKNENWIIKKAKKATESLRRPFSVQWTKLAATPKNEKKQTKD